MKNPTQTVLKRTERGEVSLTDAGLTMDDLVLALATALTGVARRMGEADASNGKPKEVKLIIDALNDLIAVAQCLQVNLRGWLGQI